MWPYSAPSSIHAHNSNGGSRNLAITMLIIYVKLDTVFLVLLYRDSTLFRHCGHFCSNTNSMLLGSVTQESPNTLVVRYQLSHCANSPAKRRLRKLGYWHQKQDRVSEPDSVPGLEQMREQGVSKYSLRRHFDQMYYPFQTSGPCSFPILTTTYV